MAEGPESRSLEISPNITVELNDRNELIGVEILHASRFLRNAVLESVQARGLIKEAPSAWDDDEDFEPVEFTGPPVSQTIIEERR